MSKFILEFVFAILVISCLCYESLSCIPSPHYWDCYTVAPGDTILAIGEKVQLDWRIICQYNSLLFYSQNCSLLTVGMQLRIPNGDFSQNSCQETEFNSCYTLREAQGLGDVRQVSNLPLDTLASANPQLSAYGILQPGTQVRIPRMTCMPNNQYTCYIPPGQTDLQAIANELGYYYSTLVDANYDRVWPSGGAFVPAGRPILIPRLCQDSPGNNSLKSTSLFKSLLIIT